MLKSIEEQGKLTDELKEKILAAQTLVVVEDLYRPYRPKRKTRASIAKEKGLEPLAEYILRQEATEPVLNEAAKYVSEEKEVKTPEEALQGAQDIIAEMISDDADHRLYIRNITVEEGIVTGTAKDEKAQSVYEMYYNFEEPVKKIAGHRVLALNRGDAEKVLTVKVNAPEERILRYLEKKLITKENEYTTPVICAAVEDSYDRLIAPAIEREIRNDLTEKAEDGAINVFGKNLEQLLLQPPIAGKVVLGWDPAFRTGCKLEVVNPKGKVLHTIVIYPTAQQNKVEEAKKEIIALFGAANAFDTPKPERLIERVLHIASNPGDLVLDSFLGSGTTAAVAHKMGRRYIGIEMGDHAYTHCKVRLDKVIAGEDPGGITKAQNWQGGGGYRFYELAPTLINKDPFDEDIINEAYNVNMLAAAVALHEGFRYRPDSNVFWKQSVGSENSYLFVTTRHINRAYLDSIKGSMEDGEYLIIACCSFDSGLDKTYENIAIKKIPQMLLDRCEFGKADYNLNIVHPPVYDDDWDEEDCDE